MKTSKFNQIIALFFLLTGFSLAAQQEFTKKWNKNFQTNLNTSVSIENQFGKIHIETWEKQELQVEVAITARHKTEKKAKEILDRIKIDERISVESISLKTNIQTGSRISKEWRKTNMESDFEINYTIKMPSSLTLSLENKFGDIYMDDFDGKLDIDLSYGQLKAGILNNKEQDIEVRFGGADIEFIANADLELKYSDLTLEKATKIDLELRFGNGELGSIDDLQIDCHYAKLSIEKVNNLEGDVMFSNFELEKLTGQFIIDSKYCKSFDIQAIESNFSLIKIDTQFSSVNLNFHENDSFQFDIETKFGHFKHSSKYNFSVYEKKERSEYIKDYEYSGTLGTVEDNLPWVEIKAQYGNVRFK